MKTIPRFLLVFLLLFALVGTQEALAGSHAHGGTVPVSGYTRSNGTYVAPYVRHAPGTASESHAFSATGGTSVIDSFPSQEQRDRINAAVKEATLPRGFSSAADRAKAIAKEPPLYRWPQNEIPRPSLRAQSHYSSMPGVLRNSHGRILRSEWAKHTFMRTTGYPNGRPGYIIDHIIPLKRGGPDDPSNMQWQTTEEAKAKDKWE